MTTQNYNTTELQQQNTTKQADNLFIHENNLDTLDAIRRWTITMSFIDTEDHFPQVSEDINNTLYDFLQEISRALQHVINSYR